MFVPLPDTVKPLKYTVDGALPNRDPAYSSEQMLDAYVAAVAALEADPAKKEAFRRRGQEWARRTFNWARATDRFIADVTEGTTSTCFANVVDPPQPRGPLLQEGG